MGGYYSSRFSRYQWSLCPLRHRFSFLHAADFFCGLELVGFMALANDAARWLLALRADTCAIGIYTLFRCLLPSTTNLRRSWLLSSPLETRFISRYCRSHS